MIKYVINRDAAPKLTLLFVARHSILLVDPLLANAC